MLGERLQLLAAEQFGCARASDLGQMRAQNRDGVERERTDGVRCFARFGRDDPRFEPIHRLARDFARDGSKNFRCCNGEQRAKAQRSFTDRFIANTNRVCRRVTREIVAQADTRQHDTDFRGERTAHFSDTVEQCIRIRCVQKREKISTDVD